MSHLTAAEALDSGEIPSLSKGLTISLTGGKQRTWRPRRLVQSTSNRMHLIPHPPNKGKHLGQRRWHVRLRNTLYRPLRTIHHGEYLFGTIVLFAQVCSAGRCLLPVGLRLAKSVHTVCVSQSMFGASYPSEYESQPINTSLALDLTVPVQIVH